MNLFFAAHRFCRDRSALESSRRFKTLSPGEFLRRFRFAGQVQLQRNRRRSNPLHASRPRVFLSRRGAHGSSGQSDLRTKADVQTRNGLFISDVSQAMIGFALTRFVRVSFCVEISLGCRVQGKPGYGLIRGDAQLTRQDAPEAVRTIDGRNGAVAPLRRTGYDAIPIAQGAFEADQAMTTCHASRGERGSCYDN
jgi:hypothetical protein